MKKHTRLMLLFGIVLCHASSSRASDNDNGPYSPAKVIPIAASVATNFAINTGLNILSQYVVAYIKQAFTTPVQEKYTVETISYNQLKKDACIQEVSDNLPADLKTALNKNDVKNLSLKERHIHLNQITEDNAQILAQTAAYTSHGNYYQIKKDKINPQVDLNKLLKELRKISSKTSENQSATVYIEFDQSQLDAPVFSAAMIQTHNLYKGTLAQALTELLKECPNIRIITNSSHKNSHHDVSTKKEAEDIRYAPTKLHDITIINPPQHKKLTPQSHDFLIVDPSFATKQEISGYVALTLKKQNNKQPQSNSFWWHSKTTPVYKPIEKDHVQDYFYDETQKLSDKKFDTYIDHARTTKCNDIEAHKPKTITAAIFSFLSLQPKPDTHINQINILSEIADKTIAQETQLYSRVPKFTPTQEIENSFENLDKDVANTKQARIDHEKLLKRIEELSKENVLPTKQYQPQAKPVTKDPELIYFENQMNPVTKDIELVNFTNQIKKDWR